MVACQRHERNFYILSHWRVKRVTTKRLAHTQILQGCRNNFIEEERKKKTAKDNLQIFISRF